MSPATESLVKKLVVLATVVGLGSALAFLLVACGSETATRPRPAAWQAIPPAPIRFDAVASSAWTGKELIVLGMQHLGSRYSAVAYEPATRSWRKPQSVPRMDTYCRSDLAWTGKELILWACGQAALDPSSGSWRMLPKAATVHGFLAWTGRELLGWGGGCCGDASDDGSAYDPAANTWRTIAKAPLPPEQGAVGAWTGHELILVVSGYSPDDKPYPASFARAAAYDPKTDSWTRLAPPPSGVLRYGGAAAWTARELLVVARHAALAYDPQANSWRRLARPPRALAPSQAFWTGRRLLVLGAGEAERLFAYDPKADRWTALPQVPVQGSQQTAAWAGNRLIVFGNAGGASFSPGD
jgi:hypothetical protein